MWPSFQNPCICDSRYSRLFWDVPVNTWICHVILFIPGLTKDKTESKHKLTSNYALFLTVLMKWQFMFYSVFITIMAVEFETTDPTDYSVKEIEPFCVFLFLSICSTHGLHKTKVNQGFLIDCLHGSLPFCVSQSVWSPGTTTYFLWFLCLATELSSTFHFPKTVGLHQRSAFKIYI